MISKAELSKILTKKLGKKIVVKQVELFSGGYHSDGYKITTSDGKRYFIKRIKVKDLGFEFPERKVMSLMVSHAMANRRKLSPESLGVIVKGKKTSVLPDMEEDDEVYHLQEYAGEGKSYLEMLNDKDNKKKVDAKDKEEIEKVLDFIVPLHKTKHPSKDKKQLTSIYNDSLRAIIGHPEYFLVNLHEMPKDNPLLKPADQEKYIGLMILNMHRLRDKYQRLAALHGDFFGSNVFFRQDGSIFVIDYSRFPWGDPGYDIGIWMAQYLTKYYITGNDYFRKLGDYFLQRYIERSGDKEIRKTMVYTLGFIGTIYASLTFLSHIPLEPRRNIYAHVVKVLEKGEFVW